VRRGDLPTIAICAAIFGMAAAGVAQFNLSVMTFDSHQISILGRSIAFHGGIEADLGMGGHGLDDRGIFQVLIQSAAIFVDTSYLYAITPIFGFSFLALYAYLAARGLGGAKVPTGQTALLVALTVVAMATTYFMLVMMLALLESYAAGAYLALAVACFWLADRERSETWLHFAHPFLIAFALQRSETPLVALLFLVIAHARCRLPRRTLVFWLVVFAVVVVGWHDQLLLSIDPGHNRNPSRALLAPLIIGSTLATTLGMIALHKPALARLRARIPSLVVICSVALFIWAAAFRSDVMGTSLVHTFDNLKSLSWGGVWFLFTLLALMSLGLPKVEQRQLFTCGAAAYLLLLFVAAAARGAPYRHGWGDSGNRMLVHIVPLLFFYFLLVFGRRPGAGETGPSRPPPDLPLSSAIARTGA